jgi:hypothetical protein
MGRFSNCRKPLASRNGPIETSKAAPKIDTSEVDHGSATPIRIAKTSEVVDHAAGSRHRRRTSAGTDSFATVLTLCLRARD